MVWRFLHHYGVKKATTVLDEFAATIVAFDPETASRAQLGVMQVELNTLGTRLAEAEAEVRREHEETRQLKQTYDEYLRAAEIMEDELKVADDPAQADDIRTGLAKIVAELERLQPEIAREEEEDREVEAWRAELRRAFETLAEKVKSAQNDLRSARRQMEMANLQKEHAAEKDRRAREAAGITRSISSVSVALDAMNQQAARARAEAETLKLKAGLFHVDRLDHDPKIAGALAKARGQDGTGAKSLSERLAALSNRNKPAPAIAAE